MCDMAQSAAASPALWQLVYASAASARFTRSDLEAILGTARKRNPRSDISGILLFEGQSFLQVLEGEQVALDALYEQIRKDPRHTRTVLLLREAIQRRSFSDWTMGYTRVTLGELSDATGVNDFFSDQDAFAGLDSAKVTRVLDLFRSGSFRQRLT